MTIETKPDRSAVGTMSTERLPIVDIAPYLDGSASDADRRKARDALDSACREFGESSTSPKGLISYRTTGFFYVTGHGLDPAYLESLLKRGHEFFELPEEKKNAIHIFKSQDGVRGYQKVGENVTYAKRDQQEVSLRAFGRRCAARADLRRSTSTPSRPIPPRTGLTAHSSGPATTTCRASKPRCSSTPRR